MHLLPTPPVPPPPPPPPPRPTTHQLHFSWVLQPSQERLHAALIFGIINFYSEVINIGRFFSRITSIRPRFHLTLHCTTAIHKSPKSLAIVTAKGKADNLVDSTVCVSHKQGDNIRYPKLTNQSDFWYKINCYYLNGKGYPANEKRYNDSNGLKHISVSSRPLFLSAGWLFTWMGLLFKLDQYDGVKYHQDHKRDVKEQDTSW